MRTVSYSILQRVTLSVLASKSRLDGTHVEGSIEEEGAGE